MMKFYKNKISKEEIKIINKEKKNLLLQWSNNRLIINKSVLQAFKSVKREQFVDPSYRVLSYKDQPLPIGFQQTISQPTTVLLMLQLLNVLPNNHVLEIGTGSGYNAALLANLAKSVVTIERNIDLTKKAKENLRSADLEDIFVFEGDGKLGYKRLAPYDRIIITAATENIPQNLENQLALGGLMVAPVGPTYGCKMLKLKKISSKKFETSSHGIFSFVPLI